MLHKKIAALVMAATIGTGVLVTGVSPASAESTSNMVSFRCEEGTGQFTFGLPTSSDGRTSYFEYRIDGGSRWYTPYKYYSYGTSRWRTTVDVRTGATTGRTWEPMSYTGTAPVWWSGNIGGGRFVEAREYRRYNNGYGYWANLGSCRTSNWSGGGIVFNTSGPGYTSPYTASPIVFTH